MYNLLYGFKVINHFKAKFYLMAEMEKSGLDEMTCHAGSVFLPSGCREAESQPLPLTEFVEEVGQDRSE